MVALRHFVTDIRVASLEHVDGLWEVVILKKKDDIECTTVDFTSEQSALDFLSFEGFEEYHD